ncbi:MAG: hypothetical protein K6G79_04695 [Bacteroidales bacterium]|nr:hypothetical protein [Bacteroidales bacterium]
MNNSLPYYEPQSLKPWTDYPWGYVYVNGQDRHFLRRYKKASEDEPFFDLETDEAKREYQWQSMWYTGGSKDIFNINVTVLPDNSDFIIGDPRTDEVNNLDDPQKYPGLYQFSTENTNDARILRYASRTGFNTEAALYGATPRSLQYYYPTDNTSRTTHMLAPSYRIASKFGGTEYGGGEFSDITKEFAEYRCAAYQEDGFPAGRWRLPTRSEIHFIAQLSAKKAFEFLFGNTVYWSAHGAIRVNANGTVSDDSTQKALLRCVYDSWYWDEVDENNKGVANFNDLQVGDPRHEPTRFLWGDKER